LQLQTESFFTMISSSALQILRDAFGYTSFRGAQQAIVEHVAAEAPL
jgi:hypothetical protein